MPPSPDPQVGVWPRFRAFVARPFRWLGSFFVPENDKETRAEKKAKKDRRLAYGLAAGLFVVGLLMLGLYSPPFGTCEARKLFGLGGLLAFAAFTTGNLFGLLFGIPKAAQGEGDELLAPRDDSRIAANNNLVQISDWLTKVLVGATLTQVTKLPVALDYFGKQYGKEIGEPAAVFVLVGFSAAGFLSGYLFTRLVLQHALHRANKPPDMGKETEPTVDERTEAETKKKEASGAVERLEHMGGEQAKRDPKEPGDPKGAP